MLIEDHHPAYISFEKYLKIQELVENNAVMKTRASNQTGAVREGSALLQGLVRSVNAFRARGDSDCDSQQFADWLTPPSIRMHD